MPLDLVTIPCRQDNYAYLIHDPQSGATALIDAPEAAPILAALSVRGWQLGQIFITHHHTDHVEGVAELRAATGAQVSGAAADAHRLPPLDRALVPGDSVTVGAESGSVLDMPGHTIGHIAFHFAAAQLLFTADSLMALGCGRLFEGTAEQMWRALGTLDALPDATLVCSGHEYTQSNARFAQTIEPGNTALHARAARIAEARAKDMPTVPSLLGLERATNPFLRAHLPHVKSSLGLPNASDVESFAELRQRKDRF